MAKMTASEKDVYLSLVPSTDKMRCYTGWDLLAVQICWGIAAWFFLVGAQTGLYLPAKEAIPVLLVGNCLPLMFIAMGGIVSARIGVEQFSATTGIFGQRGIAIILCIGVFALLVPNASVMLMFGQSATKFVKALGGPEMFSSDTGIGFMIFAYAALLIGGLIAFLGPNAMKWFTRISAVSMMLILTGFIIYAFAYHGISTIWEAKPQGQIAPTDDAVLNLYWNRASALEINIGLGISWAFVFGQWTRLAKTERGGYHGCMWGWGLLATVAGVFSAFTALATGYYDPTLWIVEIGEATKIDLLSVMGLLLMAIANTTSLATVIYTIALSLRSRWPRIKWIIVILIATLPPIVVVDPGMYDKISNVYGIVALTSGIYGGIVVADYLFGMKGRVNIRECYNRKKGYWYWKGFNPAGMIAVVVGIITYVSILNPLTWESPTGLFPYITAGLPTAIVAGVVYALLFNFWVKKKWPITFINDLKTEEEKNAEKG